MASVPTLVSNATGKNRRMERGIAMTEDRHDQLRQRLHARRAELEALLERVRSNIRRGFDPNSRERAKEMEDSDVVDTLGNEAVAELRLIKATMQRLDEGIYGICTGCGDAIVSDRLKAYPYAEFCIECAKDAERLRKRA